MPLQASDLMSRTVHSCVAQTLPLLSGLPASEQLEVACLTVLTALGSVRPRFEKSREDQLAFDLLCSDVETWLRREIETVRFGKSQ
jgi:hypothetical protein